LIIAPGSASSGPYCFLNFVIYVGQCNSKTGGDNRTARNKNIRIETPHGISNDGGI